MDFQNTQVVNDQPRYNDEIDVVGLAVNIWHNKWKIVWAVGITMLAALVYVVFAPNVYRLETAVAPPLMVDLEAVQPPGTSELVGRYRLERMTSEEVFELVKGYLQSEDEHLRFWLKYKGLKVEDLESNGDIKSDFLKFHEELKVVLPKKKDDVVVLASLDSSEPDADEMFRQFFDYVNDRAVRQLAARTNRALVFQVERLVGDMQRLREEHKVLVADDMAELNEALALAKQSGIEGIPYEKLANIELQVMNNLFLVGAKTLQIQLDALEKRKGSDAFVKGLRKLQEQLRRVKADIDSLEVNAGQAKTFLLLKPISFPIEPESPRRVLVLALSVVVGGMLGLVWIFMANLIAKIREREAAS